MYDQEVGRGFHAALIDDRRQYTGIRPLPSKCACFACSVSATAKVVKRIVLFMLGVAVVGSFVIWVLG